MRDASLPRMRAAARLANGFTLNRVKLGGYGRDVIDGLIIAAISQANVHQISRSPELQRRYATFDASPPDELRRPVSINAVASSLRIPFETARRRIAGLVATERVTVTPRGVIIPRAPLSTPGYHAFVTANHTLVRTLYHRLRALGFFDALARAPAAFGPEDPPVRLVMRLSSDYVLRLAEPVTEHIGDLLTGLILMDVIQANTEHLPDDEAGVEITARGVVADGCRRPVRVAALSERLGIAPETVRRHLARLIAADRCVRTDGGYVAPARVLARKPFRKFALINQVSMQRLFQSLAELGVLAGWDLEAAAIRGAA